MSLRYSVVALCLASVVHAASLKALIVDGQNNHDWKATTPVLKRLLEESGLFTADVATSPPKGADMSGFYPRFSDYAVVILNYNGDSWSDATNQDFERYVRTGGGFVSYHASDNAFPDWKAYQQMIAVGGWGNRKAPDSGSRVRLADGKIRLDSSPGACGHHARRLPFQVTVRDPNSPIMKGLPPVWMHAADELYDSLCGPAENLTILATARSDPANSGTGEDEPMLMTIRYGQGRVFHTAMGHDVPAMQCVGFITTFLRGAEWAATGKVSQKVPADFPAADQVRQRQ
ncbi:MAG TPA: ThuA domain-containing protein [Verrucomicrobiae bacterium]|nr:ThuA domain-containing protein [Verrucomicrobiae bacterium]